jgi:hypothetical protein
MSARGFRTSFLTSNENIPPTQPPTYSLLPEKGMPAHAPSRLDITGLQDPRGQVHWKTSVQPQEVASDISVSSPTWRDLYYRVYTQDGAVQSKNSVYPDDVSLGRTNANLVAPPHTVASIKRHLSRVEDIAGYACIKLFCDTSSAEPLDDNSIIPILTGAGPGSTPGAPIALVVSSHAETRSASSSPKSAHPDRRPTSSWLGRTMDRARSRSNPQLNDSQTQRSRDPRTSDEGHQASPVSSTFNPSLPRQADRIKRMVKTKFSAKLSDPAWLSHKKGEILFTDCVQMVCGPNNEKVIQARNAKGKVGYVYVNDVIFL